MRSEWLISLLAVLVVLGGLAVGAFIFHKKRQEKQLGQQIALIESLEQEGRYSDALDQIEAVKPRVKKDETIRTIERAAIRLLMRSDKPVEARARAESFLKEYPNDPHLGTIHYCLGKIAIENEGDPVKAAKHFETVIQNYSGDPLYPAAILGMAEVEHPTDPLVARKRLDALLEMNLDPKVRDAAENLLGQLNTALLFSRNKLEGDVFYTVKSGDRLLRIAKAHNVEAELIQNINNITDPRTLQIGRRLKIPSVDFSIRVNIGENTLTLLNNGKFFKKYRVRTGLLEGLTPTGQYTIKNKLVDPEWRDPSTGKRYPPGDPANELGSRWMGFEVSGLGIHETIHPETIGDYASRGCVGMLKKDVQELYALVPVGTPVTIVGKRKRTLLSDLEKTSGTKTP